MAEQNLMWAMLIHLGFNMWTEADNPTTIRDWDCPESKASSTLRLSRPMWNEYIDYLKECGCNTLIIDLGEGLRYESHPELAVEGSWTRDEMEKELARLRGMGFEVIPKLNFSATHDYWLGDYAHMVGSEIYRKVCVDLINEACDIFKPKYFHLGMDEENYDLQYFYNYIVIRTEHMWWRDFNLFVKTVEENNARAVMWADYIWHHEEDFLENMPKSVLMCNWFYGKKDNYTEPENDLFRRRVKGYKVLEENGYDQFPTGSNWTDTNSFPALVDYTSDIVSREHLYGYVQTHWLPFTENRRPNLWDAANRLKEARELYEAKFGKQLFFERRYFINDVNKKIKNTDRQKEREDSSQAILLFSVISGFGLLPKAFVHIDAMLILDRENDLNQLKQEILR